MVKNMLEKLNKRKKQIHNYNINARVVYNAETCLNQRGLSDLCEAVQ